MPDHSFWKRPIVEVAGLTLGIVGYGTNGRAIACAGAALGMKLLAFTPRLPAFAGPVQIGFVSLQQLFSSSDVVVLCCPLTAENAGFVDARLLATMRRSAYLVNVARGGLVRERDLADALAAGTIAGAGLDVVAREPIDPGNPLLAAPNCILTPHLGWTSVAARERLLAGVVENVRTFLEGAPSHVVNEAHLRRTVAGRDGVRGPLERRVLVPAAEGASARGLGATAETSG